MYEASFLVHDIKNNVPSQYDRENNLCYGVFSRDLGRIKFFLLCELDFYLYPPQNSVTKGLTMALCQVVFCFVWCF